MPRNRVRDQFDLFLPTASRLIAPARLAELLIRDVEFVVPQDARERIGRWISRLGLPADRERMSEESYKAEFLLDVFERLLGFRTVSSGDPYNFRREVSTETSARTPDAIVGILSREGDRVAGVVEVKGPGVALDQRSGRDDHLSPVDQAFMYSDEFDGVRWVLVTNFDEWRLYHRARGKTRCERFFTSRLLNSDELHRFHFLLRRDHLLGPDGTDGLTEALALEAWRAQETVTSEFYSEYQTKREELFAAVRLDNPEATGTTILRAVQLLLDRMVFVFFCVDRGLLPRSTTERLRSAGDRNSFAYQPHSLWDACRALFRAIDRGHPPSEIPGYNGGLFAIAELDRLAIRDNESSRAFALGDILNWDRLDFQSQLDVDVLGHIFERSISDLEALEREVAAAPGTAQISWRNEQGIFYTPEWVTGYIARRVIEEALASWPEIGANLRVLDPACGSGAFLVRAIRVFRDNLDVLAPAETAIARAGEHAPQTSLFESRDAVEPRVLYDLVQQCIYGVDLSPDSVAIAQLSCWLTTVAHNRPLPTLDSNIIAGNSLVESAEVDRMAVRWDERLPALAGGVHVIIGNPPWGASLGEYAEGLRGYRLFHGQAESAFLFIERALQLLADDGYLSFVLPDSLLVNAEAEPTRRILLTECTILELIRLGEGVFDGVFRGALILMVRKCAPPENHRYRALSLRRSDRRQVSSLTEAIDLASLMERRSVLVSLGECLARDRAPLLVDVSEGDVALLRKIETQRLDMRQLLWNGRGVELNADGRIIACPACGRWCAPPLRRQGRDLAKVCPHCGHEFELNDDIAQDHIVDMSRGPVSASERAYCSTVPDRYSIGSTGSIRIDREGIDLKEPGLYSPPKLMVRQVGIGLTATIDVNLGCYVPQSVLLFGLRTVAASAPGPYRLGYIAAVWNSRMLLYYIMRSTGDREWRSYPRWTQERLLGLPVRSIDWSSTREARLHEQIADAAEELSRVSAGSGAARDWDVEDLISELYGVASDDRRAIMDALRSVEGVDAVSRMLPRGVAASS